MDLCVERDSTLPLNARWPQRTGEHHALRQTLCLLRVVCGRHRATIPNIPLLRVQMCNVLFPAQGLCDRQCWRSVGMHPSTVLPRWREPVMHV